MFVAGVTLGLGFAGCRSFGRRCSCFLRRQRITPAGLRFKLGTVFSGRTGSARSILIGTSPGALRLVFIGGQFSIPILIEFIQSRGSVCDFIGINDSVAIGVKSGFERRRRPVSGARTTHAFALGGRGCIWRRRSSPLLCFCQDCRGGKRQGGSDKK